MYPEVNEKNCRFIVKKEDRKIICVIDNVREDVNRLVIFERSDPVNPIDSWWYLDKLKERAALPKRFVGIATCSLEDEWDEEKGKKIAFYRAKYKYAVSFFKRANFVINEIDKSVTKLVNKFNKYGEKLEETIAKMEAELSDVLTFDTEN